MNVGWMVLIQILTCSILDVCNCRITLTFYFLSEILNGGVKVTHNPLLCNVETIQWLDIVDKTRNPILEVALNSASRQCMKSSDPEYRYISSQTRISRRHVYVSGEKCHPGCFNGSCWAAGPDHCQKCKLHSLFVFRQNFI